MMDLLASQTQSSHNLTQLMENDQQVILAQAPLINNNDLTIADTDHQVSLKSSMSLLNKEKLLSMQAQVLQHGECSHHQAKMTKVGISTEPMKRQITKSWSNKRNKRNHGTSELKVENQHENINTQGNSLCSEHYGLLCLQKEGSLMMDEARHLFI